MKAERFIRIGLDAGCVVVGLGGIVHQTVVVAPGQANGLLLSTCVAVLGIPAGVGLYSQLRGAGGTGTTDSPSPLPGASSSGPSSTSPAPGAGEA